MPESVNLFDLINKEASEENADEEPQRISEQVDVEKFSSKLVKRAQQREAESEEATLDKVAEAAAVWEVLKEEGVL